MSATKMDTNTHTQATEYNTLSDTVKAWRQMRRSTLLKYAAFPAVVFTDFQSICNFTHVASVICMAIIDKTDRNMPQTVKKTYAIEESKNSTIPDQSLHVTAVRQDMQELILRLYDMQYDNASTIQKLSEFCSV